jgi:pimeloyl-ACP methyl ester carboxylesterase
VQQILKGFLVSILLIQSLSASTFLPEKFDSLGPSVKKLSSENHRTIHYIDDGEFNDIPVVFVGGLGTSVRAIRLLDFLKTMREDLSIRIISIERNGFGQTEFNRNLTISDYAQDVEEVLNYLKINKFSIFGISGGGPYAARIAARNGPRVASLHMAATPANIGVRALCEPKGENYKYASILAYPMQFFGFPKSSPVHKLEGFQDTAYDEAARAHNVRGQSADPAPLIHEISLLCKDGVTDTSLLETDVYIYRGEADDLLTHESEVSWKKNYPKANLTIRSYPDEGHDVQYRHLDQILLDIAGKGPEVLICHKGNHEMIIPSKVSQSISDGASLGLCHWEN